MASAQETATRTLISPARLNRSGASASTGSSSSWSILLFTLVFLGPLYWMVTGGLKTGQEIAQVPPTLFPQHPKLSNYATAWSDLDLGRLMLNTIFYAFGALAFQLVLDVAAAFAFSKLRPDSATSSSA